MTDHESKENFDVAIQLTPPVKSDSESDSDCFFSAKKDTKHSTGYSLRETPLRSLYCNGGTPLRETRPSNIFGSRKSRRFTCLKKEESKAVAKETYDLSSLNDAIEDIEANKRDDLCESVLADSEETKEEQSTVVESVEFKIADTEELNDDHQKSEESMNKSLRASYVVKSPVVVAVRTVHFDGQSNPEENLTPENSRPPASKIKTRQATPMFQMPQDRKNLRFQKYIKRFSQTPTKEAVSGGKNVPATEVKRVTIKTEEPKPTLTSKSSSRPTTLNHRLTFSARHSKSVPCFRSLAEISNNFLSTARIYKPTLVKLDKSGKLPLTKPKSPKLLTMQRSTRPPPPPPPRAADQPDAPKPSRKTIHSVQSVVLKKKPPTKAITPKFCTDVRQRIWNRKHNPASKESVGQGESEFVFKARPVPNFRRLQSLNANRVKQQTNERHRMIKAKPFSFESRQPIHRQKEFTVQPTVSK